MSTSIFSFFVANEVLRFSTTRNTLTWVLYKVKHFLNKILLTAGNFLSIKISLIILRESYCSDRMKLQSLFFFIPTDCLESDIYEDFNLPFKTFYTQNFPEVVVLHPLHAE